MTYKAQLTEHLWKQCEHPEACRLAAAGFAVVPNPNAVDYPDPPAPAEPQTDNGTEYNNPSEILA